MNRAERRRQEKESNKKEVVYNLTESQINKIKEDAVTGALDTAFLLMLGLPVNIILDKHEELLRLKTDKEIAMCFSNYIIDWYDSFEKGLVGLDEIKKTLIEECNINLFEMYRKRKFQ